MTPEEQAAADAAAAAAANTETDPATTEQTPPVENTPAAPVTIDGLTPEQIRAALASLASLQEAETARATEAETARQQSLSDVQREQERAQAAETAQETARVALEAEMANTNNLRLRIAAQEAARTLGYTLHASALEDALRLGDFAEVQFNEAREPQGVSEALKALVTRKPYLVDRAETPNLSGGAAGRETGIDTTDRNVQRASRELTMGF